jgi:hypothetical protein
VIGVGALIVIIAGVAVKTWGSSKKATARPKSEPLLAEDDKVAPGTTYAEA